MPRLPFLLLIEEKEAKEDQGDDRLQVGRIGAETCFGLHFIRWIGDNNLLNLRRRVRLYTPHFVSLIDE